MNNRDMNMGYREYDDYRGRRRGFSPVLLIVLLLVVFVAVFGFRIYQERFSYSKERADLNELYHIRDAYDVPVVLQNQPMDFHARLIDGRCYLDAETVITMLNRRFYYAKPELEILYCLPDEVIHTLIGSNEWHGSVSGSFTEDYLPARFEDNELYIALDYVQKFTNFEYRFYTEPNRIQMDTVWEEQTYVTASANTKLRTSGGIKSEIVTDIEKGDVMVLLDEMEKWSKVKTADAHIGYVENKRLTDKTVRTPETPQIYTEPEYATNRMDKKVNLTWHAIYGVGGNDTFYDYMNDTKGINVISPTWFSVSDAQGNLSSFASEQYISDARYRGLRIWPMLDNFNAAGTQQDFLTTQASRRYVIDQMMAAADQYGFDGINVDFESIDYQYGRDYIEFIREMSIACRQKGLTLSVDNYVPYNFNDHYDLKEQAVFADYVIIMGYDEHYSPSEPGSVASIGYVTNGITEALKKVPASKLINAVPFYTRIWVSTPGVGTTGEAYGMAAARSYLVGRGMSIFWSETDGQNYSEATLGDGSYVRCWLEDAESIRLKLEVMAGNGLTGVASWRLDYETPDVWDEILWFLSQP